MEKKPKSTSAERAKLEAAAAPMLRFEKAIREELARRQGAPPGFFVASMRDFPIPNRN